MLVLLQGPHLHIKFLENLYFTDKFGMVVQLFIFEAFHLYIKGDCVSKLCSHLYMLVVIYTWGDCLSKSCSHFMDLEL